MTTTAAAPRRAIEAEPTPTAAGGSVRAFAGTFARWLVGGAGLILAVALAVPILAGGGNFAVLSGSMEPSYRVGDLVAVLPASEAELQPGHVVTFWPEQATDVPVTHRVVSKTVGAHGATFVTQGDANNATDPPVTYDRIIGRVAWSIPLLGYAAVALAANRMLWIGIAVVAALVWILWPTRRPKTKAEEATS